MLEVIVHSIILLADSYPQLLMLRWTHNIVCAVSVGCYLPVQLGVCPSNSILGHPPTFSILHTPTFLPTSTRTHVQDGWTALLCAADQEHEDVVQLLIEVDADPDLQDEVIYTSPGNYETRSC